MMIWVSLCHRDHTSESISLQQRSVQLRSSLGCWTVLKAALGAGQGLHPVTHGLLRGVGAAVTCGHMQRTAGYQEPLKPLLQNNPHLPRSPSWLNILSFTETRAYSRLPGWLQLRERSWSFLPSLTQPKAPAPFCL